LAVKVSLVSGRERASLGNGDRHGGQRRAENSAERGGDAIIIANAVVIVSLDDGTPS